MMRARLRGLVRKPWLSQTVVGVVLATAYTTLLLAASRDVGMSRDEGFYVDAADSYAAFFQHLPHRFACEGGRCRAECTDACPGGAPCTSGLCATRVAMPCQRDAECGPTRRELVDAYWSVNREHPPLAKAMFALGHLLDRALGLFPRPSMGYRFFGALCGGLLLCALYLIGTQVYGAFAGLMAALFFALLPRVFYHAQLNCFDVPITLMVLATTYAYYRSLTSRRWAVGVGLLFGLALLTKHNAWLLPGIFGIHFAWVQLREWKHRRSGGHPRVNRWPYWLLSMLLLGPALLVVGWPWLWFDTGPRLLEYARFHLQHVHYNMAYFGVNYFRPPLPWSYPFVMTAFTVPVTTLALSLLGAARWMPGALATALFGPPTSPTSAGRLTAAARGTDPGQAGVLFFGGLLAPLVVIAMPSTPIFGGTKHWLTAYPFLALFAGLGASQLRTALADAFSRPPMPTAMSGALAGLLLLPAAIETRHSHPFGLSHYGVLAGGVQGAADRGMNRQFWGFTTGSLVDYFNAQLPRGGRVYICDTTATAWRMLQRDGRLRPQITATPDLTQADFAIVHHEHHFAEVDFQLWEAYGSVRPAHVLTYDGVPIISVYKNPARLQH